MDVLYSIKNLIYISPSLIEYTLPRDITDNGLSHTLVGHLVNIYENLPEVTY